MVHGFRPYVHLCNRILDLLNRAAKSFVQAAAMELMSILLFLVLTCATIAFGACVRHKYTGSLRQLPLPPGPPADPILGHIRSMPRLYPWKTFSDWGKQWGGTIYVHVLGKPMIIINDLAVARELMDKRGSVYSDRPRYVLFREMMGWDRVLPFLPYDDKFRKHRKMMQQHFNSQAVARFRSLQRTEIYVLLQNLLKSPEAFDSHIKRAIAGTLTMATFGYQVVTDDDDYVSLVEKAASLTIAPGAPGSTLPDFVPFLRHIPVWFPGAGLSRLARNTKELVQILSEMPYTFVKCNKMLGTAIPSFMSYLLDEYDEAGVNNPEHEKDIKDVCAIIYSAGFETSQTTLLTFVLAMVRHPEIMIRAHDEIECVIGRDRMPSLADRESLPIVDCILKECLRWNPPVPLGIPHRVMEDDVYQSMHIPKGATIVANIWQMMRDERYYSNPEQYNPDRFSRESAISSIEGLDKDDYNPLNVVFGFGRRVCPGRYFAEASLWLAMASILAAFNIKRPLDGNGSEFVPEAAFTSGTGSQPKAFRCRFVSRGEKYEEMIKSEQTSY